MFVNNNCIQLLLIYNYSKAIERREGEEKADNLIKLGKIEEKKFNLAICDVENQS